jgi:uncharacterized membrane protein
VHGGGFYRAEKFAVAPAQLPTTLHWFKWELLDLDDGLRLLVAMYYANAELPIDPEVMALSKWGAIAISVGLLVAGLAIYEASAARPSAQRQRSFSDSPRAARAGRLR